ncbi:MAG: 4-hydroxy-tetrahydrodipicolinate synthase [Bacteroidetes bacterium]|nr:4-hydroxy-tetrahydrodipicolinate synthase [Bacteroidota bacterium]MBS1630707.1 4-hydroxy-tetrahydrodipicolinate synthase [Bacteroidota bacterium]
MFRGVGVALVTPMTRTGYVDFKGLSKLVEHVIAQGVDYLVALGTTAETPTLTSDEKKEVLLSVIRQASGRVPVVCGLGGNNTQEVLDCIESYPLEGVAALLSVVPYYNKPSQEGIYQHFKKIADATRLPIILYNVPGRTVANMLPQTVLRIAKDCPNVVAIKEASGNLVQCMDIVAGKPKGFTVLSGDDNLVLPQIAVGMEGVISVAANCYTEAFCHMVHAALGGDFDTARAVHYKLLPGIDLLFAEGNPCGVKFVLSEMGLIKNSLRLPLVPASEKLSGQIKSFLQQ